MGETAGEKGGGSVALTGKTDRGRLGGKGRRRARRRGGGVLREGTGRVGRAVVERDGFPDGKQGQENERAVPEKGIMRHRVSRLGGGGGLGREWPSWRSVKKGLVVFLSHTMSRDGLFGTRGMKWILSFSISPSPPSFFSLSLLLPYGPYLALSLPFPLPLPLPFPHPLLSLFPLFPPPSIPPRIARSEVVLLLEYQLGHGGAAGGLK